VTWHRGRKVGDITSYGRGSETGEPILLRAAHGPRMSPQEFWFQILARSLRFFVLFFSPFRKMRGYCIKLGHDRFLPRPFLFINHTIVLVYSEILMYVRSRDSAGGIATSYGLDDRGVGVRAPVGSLLSPRCLDRFWDPPSLSNGYRG
jgi:hypothetical protein